MEQNRSIKELLQVMLDNQDSFITGLCHWVNKLYFIDGKISVWELYQLEIYIDKNKPMFTWYSLTGKSNAYWWKRGDIEPRIKWIKKHIKKLNKKS